MNPFIRSIGAVHDKMVFERRTAILAKNVHEMLPDCSSLLDVGCGDGAIDAALMNLRPGLKAAGVDVMKRSLTYIPVELFDGSRLPVADKSWDIVMLIDVLHHTDDARVLLAEARRVARVGIIIKDHDRRSSIDQAILAFMDWVSNRPYNVTLPYNYWSLDRWKSAWADLQLEPKEIRTRLKLYPWWARAVFESTLHFMVLLCPMDKNS